MGESNRRLVSWKQGKRRLWKKNEMVFRKREGARCWLLRPRVASENNVEHREFSLHTQSVFLNCSAKEPCFSGLRRSAIQKRTGRSVLVGCRVQSMMISMMIWWLLKIARQTSAADTSVNGQESWHNMRLQDEFRPLKSLISPNAPPYPKKNSTKFDLNVLSLGVNEGSTFRMNN